MDLYYLKKMVGHYRYREKESPFVPEKEVAVRPSIDVNLKL